MKKDICYICIALLTLCSCSRDNKVSFYHWKANARYTQSYDEALNLVQTEKIYLHYFDVKTSHKTTDGDKFYPTYVLKSVAKAYQNFEIVPVVYITNDVFKQECIDVNIENLSSKIEKLIHQISLKHFNKEIKQIQIDCDWTQSTRYAYFKLLTNLGNEFEIDATIRLHQIKFMARTGVPPVSKGTLMLYNVGDLKSKHQNSILESSIVKQYVNSKTSYPLPLNIGLPLFSQTILFKNNDRIKIIKDADREALENDSHFAKVDDTNFQVTKDTLYKGHYMDKGYSLKLEETKEREIIASYKIIKKSKLKTDEIILYHLDDESLLNIDLNRLIDRL